MRERCIDKNYWKTQKEELKVIKIGISIQNFLKIQRLNQGFHWNKFEWQYYNKSQIILLIKKKKNY